jgi:hypothetical protein
LSAIASGSSESSRSSTRSGRNFLLKYRGGATGAIPLSVAKWSEMEKVCHV